MEEAGREAGRAKGVWRIPVQAGPTEVLWPGQEWLHSRSVGRGVAPGMASEVRQARTHEVQGGVEE